MTENLLKQHWYIACLSKRLKKRPLAVTILNTPLVLFRTDTGIAALLDKCPHRNAPLSLGKIRQGKIECPYHGWQFDQHGICQRVPGLCQQSTSQTSIVQNFRATEKQDFIWVCLDNESITQPTLAFHLNSPDFNSFIWHTQVQASLANALENLLDGSHTHFVHAGLIRHDNKRQTLTAQVHHLDNGVEVHYTNEGKQSGLISQWFETGRESSYGRFIMPSIAEIEYRAKDGISLIISAYFTPMTKTLQNIHAIISIRKGKIPGWIQGLAISPFLYLALRQDKKILEAQQNNIHRFQSESFLDSKVDLIGTHIRQRLQGKKMHQRDETPVTVAF